MSDRVVVRAPATVANLGPGFDCLGLALAWYDEVRVERHDGPLEISVSGRGAENVKRDETNYIHMAMRAVMDDVPDVRIHKMVSVAYGRGFGSSAISIVAGLLAGRALGSTGHSDADLLAIASEMEGHPDNVAPCMLGGVTIVAGERVERLDPPLGVRALVCIAPSRLSTKTARAALPDTVSRAVAVASLSRAALLAATLATGRTDALMDATEDVLHQPPRFELMPDTGELVGALRAQGIAAFLSGAGPSVTALVPTARASAADSAAKQVAPDGWEVRLEDFDAVGATIVDER